MAISTMRFASGIIGGTGLGALLTLGAILGFNSTRSHDTQVNSGISNLALVAIAATALYIYSRNAR